MFDSILDALGVAGGALSAPGDYLRGALAGRPGDRASGRDMLSAWGLDPGDGLGGQIAGFGTELATDPLTYLGGAAGRLLGGRASKAAEAAGPGYSTTAGDLQRMLSEYSATADRTGQALAARRVENVLGHPNAGRLLSEIPEGSNILGAGAEGIAFGTPQGDVARLGRVFGDAATGRPVSPDVLQATRGVEVGGGPTPWLAERTPLAKMMGQETYDQVAPAVAGRLEGQGLKLADAHRGNVGFAGGRTQVIDPGAVDVGANFAGGFQPVTPAAEPSALMRQLLAVLGGPGRTREAIASGLAGPDFRTELMLAGGGLGSVGGAFGRATHGSQL